MEFGRLSEHGAQEEPGGRTGTDGLGFLSGGGATGALIRGHDWSRSPLGRPEGWPQSLRSVVGLLINSQFPMFVAWGPELGFLYNDAYAAILGDKHPTALGARFHDIWSEIWPDISPLIDAALAGEASYREDLPLVMRRRGHDEQTWFTFSYSPVRDESGAVAGMFCAVTETTERVLLEIGLRESEARFRTAADGSPALMWMSDEAGEITFANRRYRDFFGVDADAMLGGGWRSIVHPDDVDSFHQAFLDALAERRPAHLQVRVIHPRLGVRWLTCDGSPRFGPDGSFLGYVGVNLDITESVEAEQAREAQEQRFRQVADAVPAFIWFAKPNGELQYLNSRWYEYTGQTPGQALPNGWATTLHPDDMERTATAWAAAREQETRYEIEVRYRRYDGEYRWYVARAEPVRDDDGRVTAWFGTSGDIHDRRIAEAALRESEARLRALTDHLPGGMVYQIGVDTDGNRRFLHVSQSYEQLTGVSADTVLADPEIAYRSIHPDDLPALVAAETEVLRTRGPFDVQVRFVRSDGEVRWCRIISAPREQDDGSTVWDGIQIDITDEKRTQDALRERESRLRLALEAGRMAEVTFHVPEGTVSHGPAFATLLGYPPDRELSLAELRAAYHPDDRDRVLAERAAILNGTQSFYEIEKRVVWPDGQVRWLYGRGRVIRDGAGEAQAVTAVYLDETERKSAEEALRAAHAAAEAQAAERSAILGQLAEGVIVTDASGRITFVNEAATRLHGVATLDVAPDNYADTYHLLREDGSPYPSGELPLARAVLRGETVHDARWRIRRPDGTEVLAIGTAQPLLSPDGKSSLGAILTVRDDTSRHAAEQALRALADTLEHRVAERTEELEQAHEQLRQSQKLEAMGQLTGGVAHDFNNLLTPIVGSLDLLQRRGLGGDREQRLIGGALQSAERAKMLVQRLLAFARRQPLQPTAVDIAALVEGMADLIASTSGPQVRLVADIPPDLPPAKADPNQLEMAILNLAVNARDAMRDGGTLTISASEEKIGPAGRSRLAPGRYLRLRVSDTGAGMDEATLARAIEPFFSTKGIGKGTGLGLSMVHGLAQQLGGMLNLSSRPGLGTCAELLLPVSRAVPVAANGEEPAGADADQPGTVLLVDDEAIVRESTAAMLGELGYQVVEAESAETALALLGDGLEIDMLITDHLMPGMTGADLARNVRGRRPDLPVLIVSGYAEAEAIAPDLPRLVKPFRHDELAARIAPLRQKG